MSRDLFGRPIRTGPRPKQAELFSERHWFELGYLDVWRGSYTEARGGRAEVAYYLGQQAARRDRQDDDRDSNCNPARAWAQARAVGNVTD